MHSSRHHPHTEEIKKKEKRKADAWLLSMTDMIALMLTFFVLLFSMSSLINDQFLTIRDPSKTDDDLKIAESRQLTFNADKKEIRYVLPTKYIFNILEQHIAKSPLLRDVHLGRGDKWLVLSLPNTLLFRPAQDRLFPEAHLVLMELVSSLSSLGNKIVLVGHAGPEQISTVRFPSNWHLTLARATAVRQSLIELGLSGPIDIYSRSFGDFFKISNDFSPPQRRQLGRRVDIVIYEKKPD